MNKPPQRQTVPLGGASFTVSTTAAIKIILAFIKSYSVLSCAEIKYTLTLKTGVPKLFKPFPEREF